MAEPGAELRHQSQLDDLIVRPGSEVGSKSSAFGQLPNEPLLLQPNQGLGIELRFNTFRADLYRHRRKCSAKVPFDERAAASIC